MVKDAALFSAAMADVKPLDGRRRRPRTHVEPVKPQPGMTLAGAERAVGQFLERAAGRDFRLVLVVTGKGLREEGGRPMGGRIRAEFVGWLNRADNRARVRSVRPAHPHHGGSGAFYVLLRRRSSARSRSLRATPQR